MAKKPLTRTPEEEERLESLPQQVASDYEWQVWRQSNDSIIVDFFQGQFRNQLRCMSCSKARFISMVVKWLGLMMVIDINDV